MAEQVPSIGRMVHYVATNGRHVPADICECDAEDPKWCDLFVKDSATHRADFVYNVPYSELAEPCTWHWPEYVPAKG